MQLKPQVLLYCTRPEIFDFTFILSNLNQNHYSYIVCLNVCYLESLRV